MKKTLQVIKRIYLTAALFGLCCFSSFSQFFYEETGKGSSGIFTVRGDAYYTAGSTIVGDPAFPLDPAGNGWLRLTRFGMSQSGMTPYKYQAGYVTTDRAYNSDLGLVVEFDFKIWGKYSPGYQADGLCIFLYDGTVTDAQFKLAPYLGGSLGYLPFHNDRNNVVPPGWVSDGLYKGYLGVGIDEYGNFLQILKTMTEGDTNEYPTSVGNGREPSAITVVGPSWPKPTGSNLGHMLLGTTGKNLSNTPLSGSSLDRYAASARPTDAQQYWRLRVQIDPKSDGTGVLVSVYLKNSVNGNFIPVLVDVPLNQVPYPTLKVGFSGITGELAAYHEVRNIMIRTSGQLSVFKHMPDECLRPNNMFDIKTVITNNNNFNAAPVAVKDTLSANFVISGAPVVTGATFASGFEPTFTTIADGRRVYSYTVNIQPVSTATVTFTGHVPQESTSLIVESRVGITPPFGFVDDNTTDNHSVLIYSLTSGGTIGFGDQTISSGATPGVIASAQPASAGTGSFSYRWQSSTFNGNSWSAWTNISGATGLNYTPSAPLTLTTRYRRVATDACGDVYSNIYIVYVTSVYRWWYISTPFTDSNSNSFDLPVGTFGGNAGSKLGYYDELEKAYTSPVGANHTFRTRGVGIVASLDTSVAAFNPPTIATLKLGGYSNVENTGNFNVVVTNTDNDGTPGLSGKEGKNLLGNPYTFPIDYDSLFFSNMIRITSSYWVRGWNRSTNKMTYDSYNTYVGTGTGNINGINLTEVIPVMQGFWVQARTNGNVTFNSSSLIASGTAPALRAPSAKASRVARLTVKGENNASDQTLIVLNSGALDSYDDYDSEKISNYTANEGIIDNTIPEIFTKIGNRELAINGIRPVSRTASTKLGFRTGQAGHFTISVVFENWDNTKLYLRDNITGIETDLNVVGSYSFTSGVYDDTNRFTIVVDGSTTNINTVEHNTKIFANEHNKIVVQTDIPNAQCAIYNTLGQKLNMETIISSPQTLNFTLEAGVYLVRVGNKTERVIIK